ncbi:MAG: integrase core domain-containing protein, partial [Deltaproteobacteria bacterium]|nr:integrase core domain-containing protein [Deltaproteobacteria bacterium]
MAPLSLTHSALIAGSLGPVWSARAGRPRDTSTDRRKRQSGGRHRQRSSSARESTAVPRLDSERRPGPHPSTAGDGPAQTHVRTAGGTDALSGNVVAHCPNRVHSTTESNAYAERFVRSIKDECLSRMIFFGGRSLRKATREFAAHYHSERIHPPTPRPSHL